MKISIITVTFNCASTLESTFKSVNTQTARQQIEYIVIDGNSDDGTIDIIKNNKTQIDKWLSEPDKGIYDAMNKGLAMASGEWIGFLHADDLFANNTVIEDVIKNIEEKDYNTLYGDLNYISGNHPFKVIRYWKSKPFTPKLLKHGWMPPHPTLYIKNEHQKKIGNFDTAYRIAADYDFILRLFSHSETKCFYMDKTMVNMRVGGVSNNSLRNIIQKSKEDYRALRKNRIGGLMTLFIKNFSKITQFLT